MKKILFLIAALAATGCPAATITGSFEDPTEAVANIGPKFVPLQSFPAADGNKTVLGLTRTATATNGDWSIKLFGGIYRTEFPSGLRSVLALVPPDDTNTYTFNQVAAFATNMGTFVWTNPPPAGAITNGQSGVILSNSFSIRAPGNTVTLNLVGESLGGTSISLQGSPAGLAISGNVAAGSLQLTHGLLAAENLEILDTAKGVILKAPDGGRWMLKVSNAGVLSTLSIP